MNLYDNVQSHTYIENKAKALHTLLSLSLSHQVDDRRCDVERKMITLQVRYDSLEKAHFTTKQLLKKFKVVKCHYSVR